MTDSLVQRIDLAISTLYEAAEVPRPNAHCPIAPLASLVGTLNLRCIEVLGLTERVARELIAREAGSELPRCLEVEPLAGYLYAAGKMGVIFVRGDDSVQRRRFSVAHELGHYLLHFQPLLDLGVLEEVQDAFPEKEVEPEWMEAITPTLSSEVMGQELYVQRERDADLFAVEVLMSEDVVRGVATRVGRGVKHKDLEWRLASELLVSPTAMSWRMRTLGLE